MPPSPTRASSGSCGLALNERCSYTEALRERDAIGHVNLVGVDRGREARHRREHDADAVVLRGLGLQRHGAEELRHGAGHREGALLDRNALNEARRDHLDVALPRRRCVEARADRASQRDRIGHVPNRVEFPNRLAAEGIVAFVAAHDAHAEVVRHVTLEPEVERVTGLLFGTGIGRTRAGVSAGGRTFDRREIRR